MENTKNETQKKDFRQLSIDFSRPPTLAERQERDDEKTKLAKSFGDELHSLKRTIAGNCMRLRNQIGWTQRELAENLNLSQSHIQYLESGQGNPTVELMLKVAKSLEVELSEFFVKSIWELDHFGKEDFSIIKGPQFEMKKLAMSLPEGWDFQNISLGKKGEIYIAAKKKNFRQFYFCTLGLVTIQTSEEQRMLQKDEGAAIAGSQPLRIINCRDERSEVIHLCYREK